MTNPKYFTPNEIELAGIRCLLASAVSAGEIRRDKVLWKGDDGSFSAGYGPGQFSREGEYEACGLVEEYLD